MFGGGATKSAGLNQRSTVGSSSLPDPMRFGQLGAPLLTPVCSETLNGRPVVIVVMPDNCQPPTIAAAGRPIVHPAATGPEGQLVDAADDRAMAHVEAGRPVPGVQVGDRLRVADRAAAARRRAAVVERLAERVARPGTAGRSLKRCCTFERAGVVGRSVARIALQHVVDVGRSAGAAGATPASRGPGCTSFGL